MIVIKKTSIHNIHQLMVEAGGIEPPSEGLQPKAATCLVCVFESDTCRPQTGFICPLPLLLPMTPGQGQQVCPSDLTPSKGTNGRAPRGCGALRQPVRSCNRRHLMCLCLFYESAELGMLLGPQLPPSNPLRPQFDIPLIVLMLFFVKSIHLQPLPQAHSGCAR